MNVLEKLFSAANAVKAGESLQNPVVWKKVQLLTPIFLVIIATLVKFTCGDCVSEPDQSTIALGLATLAVSVNMYFTVATTTKLGVK